MGLVGDIGAIAHDIRASSGSGRPGSRRSSGRSGLRQMGTPVCEMASSIWVHGSSSRTNSGDSSVDSTTQVSLRVSPTENLTSQFRVNVDVVGLPAFA